MSNLDLILKDGTVFFKTKREVTDIGIKDGKIVEFGNLSTAKEIVNCSNLFIFPGLIDTQCHFREPGGEHKETLETGTKAAALGGIVGIILGLSFGNVVATFLEQDPVIPYEWVLYSLQICASMGIIFGLYPAIKASKLNPIDSMRFD